MSLTPTVFIVDPDPRHSAAVSGRIRELGLAAETFAGAESLLKNLSPSRPGCLLAEMDLPGTRGVELLRRLVEAGYLLPVIFMSAAVDVAAIVPALRAGAVDFLQKPCDDLALWDSLQLALQRDSGNRGERAFRADIAARLAELTDEERRVMDLLLENKPNRAIAARLDVSQRTVNFRRANVLKKLGVASLIELAGILARANYPLGGPKHRLAAPQPVSVDYPARESNGRSLAS